MRFDWTDLRIFLHVCEAGSMTAAAERCHLTLAAVSARIRNLEDSNGIVLLERRARGVAATPAGEVLAMHARLVFDQVQRLERELLGTRSTEGHRLVLLANSSALARPLADTLAGWQALAGSRPVLVRESSSEATVQTLRSGAADLGVVSDAVDTHDLVVEDLGPDPLVLVASKGHALAARTGVSFGDALAEPWIAWGESSALSAHLQLRALALGTRIEPRITYPDLGGVLRLVGAGSGVTVLPLPVLQARPPLADLACIPLEENWARRRLLLCRREGADPVRDVVVDRIRSVRWG